MNWSCPVSAPRWRAITEGSSKVSGLSKTASFCSSVRVSSTCCGRLYPKMTINTSKPDLRSIALRAMMNAGLSTDFTDEVLRETQTLAETVSEIKAIGPVRDMREVLWSSIDNSESRDLDQIEYVERLPDGRIRLLIGIADVDAFVPKGSTTDRRAFVNTV